MHAHTLASLFGIDWSDLGRNLVMFLFAYFGGKHGSSSGSSGSSPSAP